MSPDDHALLFLLVLIFAVGAWITYMVKLDHKQKRQGISPRQAELEQRVRVLEQIVTDSGARTAAQIEALSEMKAGDRQDEAKGA